MARPETQNVFVERKNIEVTAKLYERDDGMHREFRMAGTNVANRIGVLVAALGVTYSADATIMCFQEHQYGERAICIEEEAGIGDYNNLDRCKHSEALSVLEFLLNRYGNVEAL